MNNTSTNSERALFWILIILIGSNFVSLSVLGLYIPYIRFFRQLVLVLNLLLIFHFLPQNVGYQKIRLLEFFFLGLVFYLVFNILTSLDPSASFLQAVWAIAIFFILYQIFVCRSTKKFSEDVKLFTEVFLVLGAIIILISFIGGYVFDYLMFFDLRFNYTLGRMTKEFAGAFGSNNLIGIFTFLVQFFFMLYHKLKSDKKFSIWLLLAIVHSLLLIVIGNRSSMGCSFFLWILYFVYINRSFLSTVFLIVSSFLALTLNNEWVTTTLRLEQFEGGNIFGNRSHLIQEAREVIEKMDFFGVGYYNQKLSRIAYEVETESDKPLNFHNTYLAVMTELGYLGLLWIPGLILVVISKSPVSKTEPEKLVIIRLIKAFIVVILLFYLPVEDSINSPGSIAFTTFWALFVILAKGIYETDRQNLKDEKEENSIPHHSI